MLRSSVALAFVAAGLFVLPASATLAHDRDGWHQAWHGHGRGWWGPMIQVAPPPYYAPPVYYAPPPRWGWRHHHPGYDYYRR